MLAPSVDDFGFFSFSTEEVYVCSLRVLRELSDDVLHLFYGIYLSFVCGKGCYADFVRGGRTCERRGGGGRRELDGVSEFSEYIGVVLELTVDCGRFAIMPEQLFSLFPVFVDVLYGVSVDDEACSEIFCSEHVVQVGDSGEVFGVQSSEQFVKSAYSFVFSLNVYCHEVYVGRHFVE